MPRKKPKIKMTSPQNNLQVPLGTTLTIEVEISDTNVPDDGVGVFFTDLAKLAKPIYELKYGRTVAKNVTKVSFPHRPTTRGEHRIRCMGWFRATAATPNCPNSPYHNDKNVDDDGVKITVT